MTSRTSQDGGVDALFKYYRGNVIFQSISLDNKDAKKLTQQVPQTPDELKPFRQGYRKQLGGSCLHPKLKLDPQSQSLPKIFGKPQPPSDHYSDYFPKDKYIGVDSIVNEIREQVYASSTTMPLGKTLDRKYQYPSQVQNQNFRYGSITKKDEKDAKDVIYYQSEKSVSDENQSSQNRPFFKPISQIDVGEQVNRRYESTSFNPNSKFGVQSVMKPNEIKAIFEGDQINSTARIVNRRQELFQNANHLHLGMPKTSFILSDNARRNFLSMSTPSLNVQKIGVQDCLKFKDLTLADVQSSDVGRSVVIGGRNIPKKGDENRIFGVPSIRHDISPPHYTSLTNVYNYGNEPTTSKLLNPFQYSELGLTEADFSKMRSREEIKDLLESIGYKYKIGKFYGIFQRAQEIQGTSEGKVSLNCFLQAFNELDSVK